MVFSQAKVQQQASISVMKMAMSTGKEQANGMVQMLQENNKALEMSVHPHLGKTIDIRI